MNYVRGIYHSVSGLWDTQSEREDALRRVREFTNTEPVDPRGPEQVTEGEVHSLDEIDTGGRRIRRSYGRTT